jgi:hypothetical protein
MSPFIGIDTLARAKSCGLRALCARSLCVANASAASGVLNVPDAIVGIIITGSPNSLTPICGANALAHAIKAAKSIIFCQLFFFLCFFRRTDRSIVFFSLSRNQRN